MTVWHILKIILSSEVQIHEHRAKTRFILLIKSVTTSQMIFPSNRTKRPIKHFAGLSGSCTFWAHPKGRPVALPTSTVLPRKCKTSILKNSTCSGKSSQHNMGFWWFFLRHLHCCLFLLVARWKPFRPQGHASEILTWKWTSRFCEALPCLNLCPRWALWRDNTINNSGTDVPCPIADGNDT